MGSARPGWQDKNPKGLKYKEKSGDQDGVITAQLKTSPRATGKVQFKAKGSTANWPSAFSTAETFERDTVVTVQLINDSTPACWTTGFSTQ